MAADTVAGRHAVSCRIRLARNVSGLPFPCKLGDERAYSVTRDVYDAVKDAGKFSVSKISELSELERVELKERHLISADLAAGEFGAVILSPDKTVSIMLNEEDHIRAQCILKGLDLRSAFKILNEIDDVIAAKVKYAFDRNLGFLTACPTNLGTGMRASVMMFLPALGMNRSISRVIGEVNRLGIAVRGVYGEGSEAEGFMYQVSNQRSLGMSEDEIIEDVTATVTRIAALEEAAARRMLADDAAELTDTVMRAFGALTHSYKMNSNEFMTLMGELKLGVSLGLIKLKNAAALDEIIIKAQPASLTLSAGRDLGAEERDIYRSETVARELKKLAGEQGGE